MSEVASFLPALRRVQMLVLDVDGVLTDGRLFYGARGESLKSFHVSLKEAIAIERRLLEPILNAADLVIDTSRMAQVSDRNTWLTRKFAHTFSISETEWCQRATFPARMLADTAPAEVPTMIGKGQSGRGCICARAFSTPTW